MSFKRHPPKVVLQKRNDDCWAAALESWLDAVGDPRRKQSREELIKTFGGGLGVRAFRQIAASLGMTSVQLTWDEFGTDHIEELLKKSVLYAGSEIEKFSTWWHCVVLFGVSTEAVIAGKRRPAEPSYAVMDPVKGQTTWRKADFFKAGMDREVLVGWKVPGRSGTLIE
jgi:hypothetical protein